jgi:hypothetical protein
VTRRFSTGGLVLLAWFGLVCSQGCSSDEPSSPPVDEDAGTSSSSSSSGDVEPDAGPVGLPIDCTGPCRENTLTVTLGSKSGPFDRAQFGILRSGELHVEVMFGGQSACPTQTSPDPDYNLIIGLPTPVDRTPLTRDDAVGASFLDLAGSIDATFPPPKVTTLTLTPVAGQLAGESLFFAFDFHAEFEQGAVIDGHAYAEHCDSMDD